MYIYHKTPRSVPYVKLLLVAKELTPSQKQEALGYLMFLNWKHCGKIKGWECADGRKQRKYILKEDAAATTVSTEAVFLTSLIDAYQN